MTAERGPDHGVFARFLGAGDARPGLGDAGLGHRQLRRELLVGAARDVAAFDELGVTRGLDLGILGLRLGLLERRLRVAQIEGGIPVIEPDDHLAGFDEVSDPDRCLDHRAGRLRRHVG